MGEIVTVNFRGDELYGFKQDDGMFLAVKPMCEAMGLAWEPQRQRLNRDPVLSKGTSVMKVPFGRGGAQDAVCIKLELVNGFLFSIDSSRIKDPTVRERVILYQEECYQVLHDHFAGKKRAPEIEGEVDESPTLNDRRALVAEARQTFGQHAARQLWLDQKLPIVPAMFEPEHPRLFSWDMVRHSDLDQAGNG